MAYKKKGVVRDSAFYAAIGRKGGEETKKRKLAENPDYYSDIGYKGGKAILEKHGVEHFERISRTYQDKRRQEMGDYD